MEGIAFYWTSSKSFTKIKIESGPRNESCGIPHTSWMTRFHLDTVRTLREDQPLRLLLNLLFYQFNHPEPTYESQRIKLLDVIAAYSQLNVNALN